MSHSGTQGIDAYRLFLSTVMSFWTSVWYSSLIPPLSKPDSHVESEVLSLCSGRGMTSSEIEKKEWYEKEIWGSTEPLTVMVRSGGTSFELGHTQWLWELYRINIFKKYFFLFGIFHRIYRTSNEMQWNYKFSWKITSNHWFSSKILLIILMYFAPCTGLFLK